MYLYNPIIDRFIDEFDLNDFGLVFHDIHSEAMINSSVNPHVSYYGSITGCGDGVYFKTRSGLKLAKLYDWDVRFNTLFNSDFAYALAKGIDLFYGETTLAISNVPDSNRQDIISDFMAIKLLDHVKNNDKTVELADLVINACVSLEIQDFLFTEIFEEFNGNDFLVALGKAILGGKIQKSCNPDVITRLIYYYESRAELVHVLEDLIIRLDPLMLDTNHLIKTCQTYGLFTALVFLYANALLDPVTPILEICSLLIKTNEDSAYKATWKTTKTHQELIGILFFFISSVFSGKTFPLDTLSQDPNARRLVYNLLFSADYYRDNEKGTMFVDEPPFPFIRFFIKMNFKEFLRVLEIGFKDSSLNVDDIQVEGLSSGINRQFIIDAVFSIVLTSSLENILSFYCFVALNYEKYNVFIYLDDKIIKKMIKALVSCKDGSEEYERAALALLKQKTTLSDSELENLLLESTRRCYYSISEFIFEKLGKLEFIPQCYLDDKQRRSQTFTILRKLLSTDGIDFEQSFKLKQQFLDRIDDYLLLDSVCCVNMIEDFFPTMHEKIILKMLKNDQVSLLYLNALFQLLFKFEIGLESSSNLKISTDRNYKKFSNEFYLRHVYLLSMYLKSSLKDYLSFLLKIYGEIPCTDLLLKITLDNNLIEASCIIFESQSNHTSALKLLIDHFHKLITNCSADFKDSNQNELLALLRIGIGIAQRSPKTSEWLTLFDRIVDIRDECLFSINTPAKVVQDFVDPNAAIKNFAQNACKVVVEAMVGYISLPVILERLVKHHTSPNFKDFRELVYTMIENARYEIELFSCVNRIFGHGVWLDGRKALKLREQGILLKKRICGGCKLDVYTNENADSKDQICIFNCGHLFHLKVLVSNLVYGLFIVSFL